MFGQPSLDASRRGFTLIELMIVIVIIAMLVGLTSIAAFRAIDIARRGVMLHDLSQITSGVRAYKEKAKSFPPALAEENMATRKQHLIQHLRQAYPRFTPTGYTIDDQYTAIRNYILNNYSYRAGNSAAALDLDRLDQAEALVFWLGGFPTPIADGSDPPRGVSNRKLFGMHADVLNPFRRDKAPSTTTDPEYETRGRNVPYYDFDEARLVDTDGDGWLEYVPPGDDQAPYVYFDFNCYMRPGAQETVPPFLGYPRSVDNDGDPNPSFATLAGKWGLAVPIINASTLAEFPSGTINFKTLGIAWHNPDSFQIICPGLDGRYSSPSSTASWRLVSFPYSGTRAGNDGSAPKSYSDEERDNLVNFSSSQLDDGKVQ